MHEGEGKWLRPLYSGERVPIAIEFETEWAPEMVWTRWRRERISAPAGTRTSVVQVDLQCQISLKPVE